MFRSLRLGRSLARLGSAAALAGGGCAIGSAACLSWGGKSSTTHSEESKELHALGHLIGGQLADLQCFAPAELDSVLAGLRECLLGEAPSVPLDAYAPKASRVLSDRVLAHKAAEAKRNSAQDAAGLEAAASLEGARRTTSGIVYHELQHGTGAAPTPTSTVKVHYVGSLLDGTVFDSSIKRGQPAELALDSVIPGWSEGVQLMRVGGKAKLYVPSELGYGERGVGPIPPGAALVFELELIEIVNSSSISSSSSSSSSNK